MALFAKKKNMFQEKDPTVFLFGSMVTTIHLVLPFVKILSRLGTVKLHTEDKSFLVLSPEYEKVFERGNVLFEIRDEPITYEDPKNLLNSDTRYNVFVVQEFVPDMAVDAYFFEHPVSFFKNQIPNERRNTPVFTVCDVKQYPKEMRLHVQADKFVNEVQLPIKAFPAFEPLIYRYTDIRSFDGKMPEQVLHVLHSIFTTFTKYSKSDLVKIFKEEVFNAHSSK